MLQSDSEGEPRQCTGDEGGRLYWDMTDVDLLITIDSDPFWGHFTPFCTPFGVSSHFYIVCGGERNLYYVFLRMFY